MSGTEQAQAPHPHVLPIEVYLGVFAALVGLTGATVAVIIVDLGPFNIVIAMVIACIKAALVAGIFMHMAFDDKFNIAVMAMCMVFVATFVVLTMLDTQGRGLVDPIKDNYRVRDEVVQKQQEAKPGGADLRSFKSKWWATRPATELKPVQPAASH